LSFDGGKTTGKSYFSTGSEESCYDWGFSMHLTNASISLY